MPRKIRDLIGDLQKVGFVDRGGAVGKEGDDAKHYQEKAVRLAIEEAKR